MEAAIDITQQEALTLQGTVGQNFSIKMQGNPSTGYNWYLDSENSDSNAVACLNLSEYGTGDYLKAEQAGGNLGMICGAPGYSVFNFEIKQAGEHKVTLIYKRGWESTVAQCKVLTFIA